MKDNTSPEEKLLRLIRGQKKQPDTVTSDIKSTLDASTEIKVNLEQRSKGKYSKFLAIQKRLSFLFNTRKITWILFVVSCFYLIISFIYPWIGLKATNFLQTTPEEITELKPEPTQEVKPFEFYSEGIKNRQIFGVVSGQEQEKSSAAEKVELPKDISLVGIISGEPLQAVIEDKKIQKTYYVTKGQYIREFQVEDIQEGKIILNYNGQKFELYL